MRKGEKQPKMVFKNHYDLLSREKKIELRDEFLRQSGVSLPSFFIKNRHKAQRKAKFYINKCRSASCMQGGLKQASA